MKNHFIDKISIIIDGKDIEIVTVTGKIYNPNSIKDKAINMVKESFPNSKLSSVIIEHTDLTEEEYKNIDGSNLTWFLNIN